MNFNKRVLAAAALSVSLVVPTVAPVAQAAEHLDCEQAFQVKQDFDGTASIVVAQHLRKNCGLSAGEISELSVAELKKVAQELKDKDGKPLSEEKINGINKAEVSGAAKDAAEEDEKEAASQNAEVEAEQLTVAPQVNDIKAGDKEVIGAVRLYPSEKNYEFAATFPGGAVEKIAVKAPAEDATVDFKIAVPKGVELKAGDEVFVTPVPNTVNPQTGEGTGQNIVVKPADVADNGQGNNDDEGKKPGNDLSSKGSSDAGKAIAAFAGLGGLAALVAGVAHLVNQNLGGVPFLQPIREFLAQFNIHI